MSNNIRLIATLTAMLLTAGLLLAGAAYLTNGQSTDCTTASYVYTNGRMAPLYDCN